MRNRRLVVTCASTLASLTLSALAIPALAVSTRVFELDDVPTFTSGTLDRTSVRSDGTVRVGVELRRIALTDVPVAYRFVRARGGTVYVGTGNDGKIYKLAGSAVTEFANTHQLLVSALAIGDGDVLYAGTLPEGRIYAIQPSGQMREVVRPQGAEHVWALTWDARRHTLFAATGPEGKVFAIDRSGRADVYWDSEASHVMSLALDDDGTLYAGTSDDALVVRLRAPGRAEVVWDFPGNEITALDVHQGTLAVAANDFPDPPGASAPTKAPLSASAPPSSTSSGSRPRAGKGKLFRVGPDGRAEELFSNDDAHFTCVQLAPDSTIYAGSGKDGRIYRVDPDRSSATWIDVDERQVLGIDLIGQSPMFITGDVGAIYQIVAGPARNAMWTSKPLDARFVSRWGELTWRADGRVRVETRSGNTERPDTTWSAWSEALAQPGPIRSPASRFLQLRVQFDSDPNAVLRAIQAYYLPQNQRAVMREVTITAPEPSTTPDPRPPSSVQKLTWKVDNADADRLRFRIRFRSEGQNAWREILRESETLTQTTYSWETNGVPDGWYRVQVEASDELANAERYVLRTTIDSAPILVDNHAPRIEDLRTTAGHVLGRAVDSVGPIAKLEYAVDGGEWRMFFPGDDLLDTRDEAFDLEPSALGSGSHIVAIRASDAAGNVVSAETSLAAVAGAVRPAAPAARPAPARPNPP